MEVLASVGGGVELLGLHGEGGDPRRWRIVFMLCCADSAIAEIRHATSFTVALLYCDV